MSTHTSLLAQLTAGPLARPCDEPWERMRGDDRVRRCAACAREVFDLSAMNAREAEIRLLNAGVTTPCIRYARHRDGTVLHAAPPRRAPGVPPSRSMVAATALGVTLSAANAYANDPPNSPAKAPAQCVAYAQAPAAPAPAPAAAPSAQAGAPQKRPAAAPPAPAVEPIEPMRLGGAPPPITTQPAYGTLVLRSKLAREVVIVGVSLKAPLASYLLTPGDFIADVVDPGGKRRAVRFTIRKDKQTIVDLDKR